MTQSKPALSPFRILTALCLAFLLTLVLLLSTGVPTEVAAQENQTNSFSLFLPGIVQQNNANLRVVTWLDLLNHYRRLAGLTALNENSNLSSGSRNHSRYMVKNDIVAHTEDEGNVWFTQEGLNAAQSGDLIASGEASAGDDYAIVTWMESPFHAIGILDPALQQTGFGSYREADGGLQMGATLDVLRGVGPIPSEVHYPIYWPGQGAQIELKAYGGGEFPDPLSSCPGYSAPTGLPIILQVGPGNLTPNVSAYSLMVNGETLESCAFSELTYTNSNQALQDLARSILNERDAIVLIPRQPLAPGAAYTATITVNDQVYSWSFQVTAQRTQDIVLP